MSKTIIMPADIYVVINKTLLNDHDRRLLSMLYQPIIGSMAVNLYFTLWSYLDKSEVLSHTWTHHHLMSSMQLNLENITEAREKLEAIGLIKTYMKEGSVNTFIYMLYSPISADEFLDNPILSTTLYSSIGRDEYLKLVDFFKLPQVNLKDYKNITTSFNEVFEIGKIVDMPSSGSKRKVNKLGLSIDPVIDLDTVLGLIPKEILNYRSVTNEIKSILGKISLAYNFNEDMLSEIIRNSIDEKHTIDISLLKDNARKYYQFENGNRLPNMVYRNQPEYLRKPIGDTSLRAKMIYKFENTTPYDFLVGKTGAPKLSNSDVGLLNLLLVDIGLKPGVVNVLIDYVLRINNNKLTKAFVESIASQWMRSSIETVESAMKLCEVEYKNRGNYKKNSNTPKTTKKPDWFDKEIDDGEVSGEQLEALKKKLGVE